MLGDSDSDSGRAWPVNGVIASAQVAATAARSSRAAWAAPAGPAGTAARDVAAASLGLGNRLRALLGGSAETPAAALSQPRVLSCQRENREFSRASEKDTSRYLNSAFQNAILKKLADRHAATLLAACCCRGVGVGQLSSR